MIVHNCSIQSCTRSCCVSHCCWRLLRHHMLIAQLRVVTICAVFMVIGYTTRAFACATKCTLLLTLFRRVHTMYHLDTMLTQRTNVRVGASRNWRRLCWTECLHRLVRRSFTWDCPATPPPTLSCFGVHWYWFPLGTCSKTQTHLCWHWVWWHMCVGGCGSLSTLVCLAPTITKTATASPVTSGKREQKDVVDVVRFGFNVFRKNSTYYK